jgi:hypothetical protein
MILLESLGDRPDRPADLGVFLAAAATAGDRPLPQHAWTLIGLLHYQDRTWWAWKVYQAHVRPLFRDGDAPGADAGPDWACAGRGIVPGLPDWKYDLDGNCSFLIHRGSGEKVHIDILNGAGDMKDWAYRDYVETHREPGPAEQRLRALFPRGGGLGLALRDLVRDHVVHPLDEPDFELCHAVTDHVDAAEEFLTRWEDPVERLPLAALIGDWAAAHETAQALGRTDLTAVTGPRAEQCRQRWLRRLRRRAARAGLDEDVLLALAHAGEDLPHLLDGALASSETADAALDLVAEDPAWCARVFALLTEASEGTLDCGLDREYARYLARHAYRVRDVIDLLAAQPDPPRELLITLALAAAPDRLDAFLRQGLRSRSPADRLTAAAALALRDNGRSRRLLLTRLREVPGGGPAAECLAALRESRDPEARRAADRWEARNVEGALPPTAPHGGSGAGCQSRTRQLREKMAEL